MSRYYVSTCPDTGRQFLCETAKDGNIIELTAGTVQLIAASGRLLKMMRDAHNSVSDWKDEVEPLLDEFQSTPYTF